MLNLKNLFSGAEKGKKFKVLLISGKDAFFDKIDMSSVFRCFRSEERIW
jgi:hypothetical protein